jgi:hypothetical protein
MANGEIPSFEICDPRSPDTAARHPAPLSPKRMKSPRPRPRPQAKLSSTPAQGSTLPSYIQPKCQLKKPGGRNWGGGLSSHHPSKLDEEVAGLCPVLAARAVVLLPGIGAPCVAAWLETKEAGPHCFISSPERIAKEIWASRAEDVFAGPIS